MKISFKKIFILIIFNFSFLISAYADTKIYYIDLDFIFENTRMGKNIILELEAIKKKNNENYPALQKNLKQEETDLINSKNIISENEFNDKMNNLKIRIENFLNERTKSINDYENIKKNKFNVFFQKISPIIQDYMNENSIDILLEKKNIFISKSDYDISSIIIKKIDN